MCVCGGAKGEEGWCVYVCKLEFNTSTNKGRERTCQKIYAGYEFEKINFEFLLKPYTK